MLTTDSLPSALRTLTLDGWLLFFARFIRLFAYGSLSVVLVFYPIGLGLSDSQTGLLLTLTLVGDTVVSLHLTTRADRIGRRRTESRISRSKLQHKPLKRLSPELPRASCVCQFHHFRF